MLSHNRLLLSCAFTEPSLAFEPPPFNDQPILPKEVDVCPSGRADFICLAFQLLLAELLRRKGRITEADSVEQLEQVYREQEGVENRPGEFQDALAEPQDHAGLFASAGFVSTEEFGKKYGLVLLGDADPGIGNTEVD